MVKVCIVGAAGGIGQPLSLLLRKNENIRTLTLYDICDTKGIIEDLKGCNYSSKIKGFTGIDNLNEALKKSDIIVVVAGQTISLDQSREELFPVNAQIMVDITKVAAKVCPKAFIAIVTNPINALVPLTVLALQEEGIEDAHKRVFGVTTLDLTRASVLASKLISGPVEDIFVPVVGGHDGITIVPLLSQAKPKAPAILTPEKNLDFMKELQDAGPKVLKAKGGKITATLSTADAVAKFTNSLVLAKTGQKVKEYTYVKSNILAGCNFFASQVEINKHGVLRMFPLGDMTEIEEKAIEDAVPLLKSSEENAINFTTLESPEREMRVKRQQAKESK